METGGGGGASCVGMATVEALGVAKGDWWEILKPLGAWGRWSQMVRGLATVRRSGLS